MTNTLHDKVHISVI